MASCTYHEIIDIHNPCNCCIMENGKGGWKLHLFRCQPSGNLIFIGLHKELHLWLLELVLNDTVQHHICWLRISSAYRDCLDFEYKARCNILTILWCVALNNERKLIVHPKVKSLASMNRITIEVHNHKLIIIEIWIQFNHTLLVRHYNIFDPLHNISLWFGCI